MRTFTIRAPGGRSRVLAGAGLLGRAGALIRSATGAPRVFVVSSRPVARFHGAVLRASLRRARLPARWLLVPDGEAAKTPAALIGLLRGLARARAGRGDVVVAFGGGTVGDVGGLAAALFARGLRIIQIPTTLEAQVDAAIGGKTAINLPEGKNLAGAFHQPVLVIADPAVLRTLPLRQVRAGLAEVVKCGVIADAKLFGWMERAATALRGGDPAALRRAIVAAAGIKARVVSADERERGRRIILNFGHTLGHGLEAAGGFRRLAHGEAVAIGMVAAARLSVRRGLCAPVVARRIESLVRAIGLPAAPPAGVRWSAVARAMLVDKKRAGARLRLVLTRRIGAVTVGDGFMPADILGELVPNRSR